MKFKNLFRTICKQNAEQILIHIIKRIFFENNIKRELSEEQKYRLVWPFSKQELHAALMSIKKGKTVGTNGFTSEFCKQFWSLLGAFLFRVAQEGLWNKSLLCSHRQSIATLIPKHGKPKDNIKRMQASIFTECRF